MRPRTATDTWLRLSNKVSTDAEIGRHGRSLGESVHLATAKGKLGLSNRAPGVTSNKNRIDVVVTVTTSEFPVTVIGVSGPIRVDTEVVAELYQRSQNFSDVLRWSSPLILTSTNPGNDESSVDHIAPDIDCPTVRFLDAVVSAWNRQFKSSSASSSVDYSDVWIRLALLVAAAWIRLDRRASVDQAETLGDRAALLRELSKHASELISPPHPVSQSALKCLDILRKVRDFAKESPAYDGFKLSGALESAVDSAAS